MTSTRLPSLPAFLLLFALTFTATATPAHADTPAPTNAPAAVQEDDPSFNCATMGNHICGPQNSENLSAGCYDDGVLVIEWTRYDNPTADPLWAQETSPCLGQRPTQEQESDAAYAAAQAELYGTTDYAKCGTDAQCAAWDEAHGITDHGNGAVKPAAVSTPTAEDTGHTDTCVTWDGDVVPDTSPNCRHIDYDTHNLPCQQGAGCVNFNGNPWVCELMAPAPTESVYCHEAATP